MKTAAGFIIFGFATICYSTSSVPVGHLQPLGFQRPPSVEVDEFDVNNAPTPEEFYNKYVKTSKAAVFRNAGTTAEAFTGWSVEYIKEKFGDLEVRLEGKREKGSFHPAGEKYLGRDSLGHFAQTGRNLSSKIYVVSELPEPMFSGVTVMPSVSACGEMAKRFVEIDLWWSSGGSHSVIHKDAYNQINCLYKGVKQWKLFEHKYEKWLHKHWEPENEIGGFSDINVESVDMYAHPNIAEVPWSNITINAGDCLFLPKSYYHQVDSSPTNNLAVSILFSRFDGRETIDMSDCNPDTDYKTAKRLSELDVMWKWSGKGMMSMGNGDFEENYRQELLGVATDLNSAGQKLTAGHLAETYGGDGDGKLRTGNFTKALESIDANHDGSLSVEEITQATWDALRVFGLETEYFEPSNSYDYEYTMVPYEHVLKLLKTLIKRTKKFTRDQWVRLYTQQTDGTKNRANDIFTWIAGSGETSVVTSVDITTNAIDKALEKYLQYSRKEEDEEEDYEGSDDDILNRKKEEL